MINVCYLSHPASSKFLTKDGKLSSAFKIFKGFQIVTAFISVVFFLYGSDSFNNKIMHERAVTYTNRKVKIFKQLENVAQINIYNFFFYNVFILNAFSLVSC